MSEQEKIEQAIAAQEGLRGTLDDAIVDATIAALKKRLEELETTSHVQRRKLVTILFMDTVGSTEMIRVLDPEDNLAIMDTALQRLTVPVEAHGGRVTRYMGDGFLAVFGLPQAQENDPVMAVHAGLGILATAVQYASEVAAKFRVRGFSVRVGIDTGPVVTGGRSEGEDTLAGSAVNLAARVESAAQPGTLLVSRRTYRHIRGVFDFQPQDPIQAKGFPEPVQVYQVLRAKERSFRTRRRGVEGIETRMVGRQAEMQTLQSGYAVVVEDGDCQVMTITGDAGLGKSRLLYEFENWVDLQPRSMRPYRGRARLETRGLPYSLLRDLFAFHFAIHDDDLAGDARQNFVSGFQEILGPGEETEIKASFAGQLLGYDFRSSQHIAAVLDDPQQIWERALLAIADYLQAAASQQPLLLLLEDIHWADDASLDTVSRLVQSLDETPVLLLCTTRPTLYERRPSWFEGRSFHRRLELQPLSRRDSRQLVQDVLQKVELVPEALRDLVVSNAEGNPFYVEELIKMLIEDGVVVKGEARWQVVLDRLRAVNVPATLTGVLQARLDGLPEEERLLLQQASVIGRVFWDVVLAYLNQGEGGGLAEEAVLNRLEVLREREMVYRRDLSTFSGSAEHIFKHAILREVTYETVLKRARRAYHDLVAEWLVEHSGERAGESPEIPEHASQIAYHLEQAGKKGKALAYLRLAGDQAAATYANEEAGGHYRRALILASQTNSGGDEITYLYRQLGRVLELSNHYHEALDNYNEMEKSALDRDDRSMLLAALMGQITLHSVLSATFDAARAEALLEKSLDLARELDDGQAEAKILWSCVNLYRFTGKVPLAIEYGERSLALARSLDIGEQMAYTLNDLAHCYQDIGQTGKAKKAYQEAGAIWQEHGNRPMFADSLSSLVTLHKYAGEYEEAIAASKNAYEICQAIGNIRGQAYSLLMVGTVYWDRGQPDRALETMKECLRLTRLADLTVIDFFIYAWMADVYAGLGDPGQGLILARQAQAMADIGLPHYRVVPLITLIEIHLMEGDLAAAEAILDLMQDDANRSTHALLDVSNLLAECRVAMGRGEYEETSRLAGELLSKAKAYGMGSSVPEALTLWGQAQAALGHLEMARGKLEEARTAAETMGSQMMLWPILFNLSQLAEDAIEAQNLRRQAGAIIREIAANVSSDELRAKFLNRPRVKAVLA